MISLTETLAQVDQRVEALTVEIETLTAERERWVKVRAAMADALGPAPTVGLRTAKGAKERAVRATGETPEAGRRARPTLAGAVVPNEAAILAFLSTPRTSQEVADHAKAKRASVNVWLVRLETAGKAKRTGQSRATRWSTT